MPDKFSIDASWKRWNSETLLRGGIPTELTRVLMDHGFVGQQDADLSPFVDIEEFPAIRDALIRAFEELRQRIRNYPVDAKEEIRPLVEGEAGGPDHVTWPAG